MWHGLAEGAHFMSRICARQGRMDVAPEEETTDKTQAEGNCPARQPWVKPKLERLSMRAAETANQTFRNNDAVNNYS
jgi:hypothetical protein